MVRVGSLRDRISVYRGAVTAAFVLAAAALVAVADRPVPFLLVVLIVLMAVFLLANTFDAFRAHPLYHLLSAVQTAILFGGWYVVTGSDSAVLLALTGLSLLGVGVETYNHRNGTSHLRIDLTGRSE